MKKGWFAKDVSRLGEGHTETVTEVGLEDLDRQEIRQQKSVWQSQDTVQGTRDPLQGQCLQIQLRCITNLSAGTQLLTQRTEVLLVYDEWRNPSTLEVWD